MRYDLTAVREGRQTLAEVFKDLDWTTLPQLTGEVYDEIDGIIGGASDATVTFQPTDPHIANPDDVAWTLGHVVVHLTAGLEEAAALGATLARGAEPEGRPRHETDWETIKTAAQVRQRLDESRRISLAYLQAWPDQPHLNLAYTPIPRFGPMNAVGRHMLGVVHAQGHQDQLREIMRQANR